MDKQMLGKDRRKESNKKYWKGLSPAKKEQYKKEKLANNKKLTALAAQPDAPPEVLEAVRVRREKGLARQHKLHQKKKQAVGSSSRLTWQTVIEQLSKRSNPNDLQWLQAEILPQYGTRNFLKVDDYRSMGELVLKAFKVHDLDPRLCTRQAPKYSIYHTLSYFCQPEPIVPSNLQPSWKSPTNRSVYFDAAAIGSVPELRVAMENVVTQSVPTWLRDYHYGNLILDKDELVEHIKNDSGFFDPFPVSKLGTNYSKGLIPLVESQQPGPRRLNLSDKFDDGKYDSHFKCSVYEGYSYTLSFCPEFHYYGRSFESHPAIAELKVILWRLLWPWLTPVSQVCPPNGCQVLAYFMLFGARINAHKDMNPLMQVDTDVNSQIVGSSVMVVNLLASQLFEFCQKVKGYKGKATKFECVSDQHRFLTEHCSVYIMDSKDDLEWYHQTKFPTGTPKNEARISITFR